MILRKPYAFLIKYFKVIHITMFLMFVYFVFALRKIYMFFVNYVKTGSFTYLSNMASQYVSPLLFVFAIIITISAILIFLLMRKKQKPVLFYRILIIYSTFLLVALSFYTTFFVSLANTTYTPLSVVIYRDIMAFMYYINFFFVGFTFIRGFGFDIKKFSFDRDKKELKLDSEDNEEFEVGLQLDKDSVVSYLKRERRELKYYIKENALVLSIISIILFVIAAYNIYNYFFVVNKVYQQTDEIIVDNVKYKVNSVYKTGVDRYGTIISNTHNFIIVNLNIYNLDDITLDKETFRIHINDSFYYPVYNYYDEFSDLGEGYYNKKLKEGTNKDYLLIFKIDVKNYSEEAYFEILKEKSNDGYTYNRMLINASTNEKNKSEYKLNDNIEVDGYSLAIESYEFKDNDAYKYEECYNDKCSMFTKIVKPKLNSVLLVMKIRENTELPKNFVNNYFGLIYDSKELSRKNMELIDQNEDTYYFNVPKSIGEAFKITVKIGTRNSEYDVVIKEDNNE